METEVDTRIREDLPEARPILRAIDRICRMAERRHAAQGPDMRMLTHASQMLTSEESGRLHELKMRLRSKSREEAAADIRRKREERARAREVSGGR